MSLCMSFFHSVFGYSCDLIMSWAVAPLPKFFFMYFLGSHKVSNAQRFRLQDHATVLSYLTSKVPALRLNAFTRCLVRWSRDEYKEMSNLVLACDSRKCRSEKKKNKKVLTRVGFEPTPEDSRYPRVLEVSSLMLRLRPLGHLALDA